MIRRKLFGLLGAAPIAAVASVPKIDPSQTLRDELTKAKALISELKRKNNPSMLDELAETIQQYVPKEWHVLIEMDRDILLQQNIMVVSFFSFITSKRVEETISKDVVEKAKACVSTHAGKYFGGEEYYLIFGNKTETKEPTVSGV